MVAHTFYPCTQEAEEELVSEFKVSLVYRASSRTAKAAQKNLSLETKTKEGIKRGRKKRRIKRFVLVQFNVSC